MPTTGTRQMVFLKQNNRKNRLNYINRKGLNVYSFSVFSLLLTACCLLLNNNLLISVENYLKEILKMNLQVSKTHSLIDCFNITKLVSGFFIAIF